MGGIWELITGDLKFYWMLAIGGSLVFVIQLFFSFFGFGMDHDVDAGGVGADHDVGAAEHLDAGFSAFKLFSVRSLIAFITFFGWGGVVWGKSGPSGFFAALASGFFMMFVTSGMLYFFLRLQQSGNINPQDYVGSKGTVYIKIPGGQTEHGKVTVTIRNSTREIIAVAEEEIPSGASVTVVKQVDGRRFLVKKV